MKKTLLRLSALLASICLMLPAVSPAFAADETSLVWKLEKQLSNGSGLNIQAAFDKSERVPDTRNPVLEALLSGLLGGSTLEFRRLKAAFGSQKGREETALSLGDLKFRYIADGTLESFSFSPLGDKVYGAAKGESAFSLMSLSGSERAQGMERLLIAVLTADNEWKARANALKIPYTDELGSWMQRFTTVRTETAQDGSIQTVTEMTLPASEIKSQLKSMLNRFFADSALQAVLKEKLTARENNLYLNPDMASAFLGAADALPLEEEVRVRRLFGKDGVLVKDDITLPMAGVWGLKSLRYELSADEQGNRQTTVIAEELPGSDKPGAVHTLKYSEPAGLKASEKQVTGSYLASRPGETAAEYTFTLRAVCEDAVFDRTRDTYTQAFDAALEIAKKDGAAHVFSLKGELMSASSPRAATKLEGVFEWTQRDTDAKISASITGSSAAPWSIPQVDATQTVRLDAMKEDELKALHLEWLGKLQSMLPALLPGRPARP